MEKQYTIDDLLSIIETLRGENGCPWDKAQTHESIKKSMIEEVYEAIDALDKHDDKMFANELGDVLMQVAFHSQLAKERNAFDFNTVLNEICEKLITRHTHVFGNDKAVNADEALVRWEQNKKKEKKLDSAVDVLKDVPKYLPALMRAEKVQKKAETFGKKTDREELFKNISEEIKNIYNDKDAEKNYEELLFNTVCLGRKLDITPEIALADSIDKFICECEKDKSFK